MELDNIENRPVAVEVDAEPEKLPSGVEIGGDVDAEPSQPTTAGQQREICDAVRHDDVDAPRAVELDMSAERQEPEAPVVNAAVDGVEETHEEAEEESDAADAPSDAAAADDDAPPVETKTALLDSPLVVSGKRSRQTRDITANPAPIVVVKKTVESVGTGTPLGEIVSVNSRIDAAKKEAETGALHTLHRILYNRAGKGHEYRKNLRKFNGFAFAADSSDASKVHDKLLKVPPQQFAFIKSLFQQGGTKKTEAADAIVKFLCEPKDEGKRVKGGAAKRKRAKSTGKSKPKSKAKRTKKDVSEANDVDDEESAEESENDDSATDDKNESDYEAESTAMKPAKQRKIAKPTKAVVKAKTTKAKTKADVSSDSDSDDSAPKSSAIVEPAIKLPSPTKVAAPAVAAVDAAVEVDAELADALRAATADVVKSIDPANVSMNQVLKQVAEKFADEHPNLFDDKKCKQLVKAEVIKRISDQ